MSALPVADKQDSVDVDFRDVRRVFPGTVALDGLNLHIPGGELLALLGPSGCGKTTALRLLAGFDSPDAGTISVGGRDVRGLPPNQRDMGMVFQAYSLFPTMTARDNVGFGLRMRRHDSGKRSARATDLLELVGLSEHIDKYPHQLSGGQQQRVALARALAIQPRVLLLDEPLSALDAKVREQLRDEIRRLQVELGVTTLFVTHDQEEALSMADQVGVMRAGRLEQIAAPQRLYDEPATSFVATFVGTMNRLEAIMVDGASVRVGDQTLPIRGAAPGGAGTPVEVLVRPEAVRIRPAVDGVWEVFVATFRGATTRLQLRRGQESALADIPSEVASAYPPGARCSVSLPDGPALVAPPQSSAA